MKEGDDIAAEYKAPAINAALIAATQKVEYYEMATYGCLRVGGTAWQQERRLHHQGNSERGKNREQITQRTRALQEQRRSNGRTGRRRR